MRVWINRRGDSDGSHSPGRHRPAPRHTRARSGEENLGRSVDFLVYESRRRLLASLATVWQYAELELSWNIEEIITGHRLVLPSGVVRPEGGEKLSTVVDYLNWLGAQGWECFESAVLAGGYNRVGVLRMRFKRPQAVAAESDPIAFRP